MLRPSLANGEHWDLGFQQRSHAPRRTRSWLLSVPRWIRWAHSRGCSNPSAVQRSVLISLATPVARLPQYLPATVPLQELQAEARCAAARGLAQAGGAAVSGQAQGACYLEGHSSISTSRVLSAMRAT